MEEIQTILGLPVSDRSEKRVKSFLDKFYDEEKKCFCDTPDKSHSALHSNVIPAFYGFAPEESKPVIREMIKQKGLSCGTQFSYFVLKALGQVGTLEDQLQLLTNESEHSWVNMLREGATTTYEAWGKDQKSNTSFCHPWGCSPVIVLIEDILKVDPSEFGKNGITQLKL